MSAKAKLAIACVLASMALGAATADAFVWHMRYGQAKNATKEFAREACREDRECIGWGVGQCYRRSQSSFVCTMGLFYPGIEPGEEIECDVRLRWGASRGGYITLKNAGSPHCFKVT